MSVWLKVMPIVYIQLSFLIKIKNMADSKLISELMKRNYRERDFFHDMMPHKVKNILLISHLYDALSIESEGTTADKVMGDYYKMNLTSAPRIINVNSYEEAEKYLKSNKKIDMAIIIAGADKKKPVTISKKIKTKFKKLPIFLLVNNNSDIDFFKKNNEHHSNIDNIFVWNGDSSIFIVMIKLLEDRKNLSNDTKIGYSRIILLVEDSEKYYSRYLPILYRSVTQQTKAVIDETNTDNNLHKVLKMRMRPKVILATTYEEAIYIYNRYRNYMLCLITDVEYYKDNKSDTKAGFKLVKYVKSITPELPTAVQSSDENNKKQSEELFSLFINKNSDSLARDIRYFIKYNLGFGDFVFRNNKRVRVNRASNMIEFFEKLKYKKEISDESLIYHASKNHFSIWLRARGEIKLAEKVVSIKLSDFKNIDDFRISIINTFTENRIEQNRGKIIGIEDKIVKYESNIGRLAPGALGGKGRGIAFIVNMIYNLNIGHLTPEINLKSPLTFIIGTDEYDNFIRDNELYDLIFKEKKYDKIKVAFLNAKLSVELGERLVRMLEIVEKPLAVRSSGLFEDSLMQPFAGVFATYILPNNNIDINKRTKQLKDAVKLVFASIFSDISQNFIKSVNYKPEEEKMAVVIQEVVGNKYGDIYYPHISGTAQSYNYYPFGRIKPEDGSAVTAVGLGIYIVEGEKAYRFSPAHPTLQNNTIKDLMKNSQTKFYAIDLSQKDIKLLESEIAGLIRTDISRAEKVNYKSFKHCVSVYSRDNDILAPGIDRAGKRVVNFANILKYNYIPLADTIKQILKQMEAAMGTSVEIEYAVDLNKDENGKATFYILQVKPLVGNDGDYRIDLEKIDKDNTLLFSENAMGNGIIENIRDIVFVPPETFDKSKTEIIATQISAINEKMVKNKKNYVLIGPGRWGTRDKWIGIPVKWTQISNAKIIVETSLFEFPLEASSGSHFFHNVTSMNVGYISVQHSSEKSNIAWNKLNEQTIKEQTNFVKHIQFKKNLKIQTDGKKKIAVIEY